MLSNQKFPGIGLPVFLTAYDPSDIPGNSLDPLGFERGYLFLADKILPGLTNVADRPRYFSVLCAGASIAELLLDETPRRQYQRRLECIERFERFWALANVLASHGAGKGELPVTDIRCVTYAATRADSLLREPARRVDANFKLLSRQVPYGVVGLYGAVADRMRLLDRKTFSLTPDLGQRLADSFLKETETPQILIKAVREDGDLSLAALTEWGLRAHISGKTLPTEGLCMKEALHRDPVRSRMADALAAHQFQVHSSDNELKRLRRLLPALERDPSCLDLKEAVSAILSYEACYQLVMLGFERLLWLCRTLPAAAANSSDLNSDPVLQLVCGQLPAASASLGATLDTARSAQFRDGLYRVEDTRRFLERSSSSCGSPESLMREVLVRHSDVQRGKFDRGRSKMPWLEVKPNHISLTMTRVGGLNWEASVPSDITPHPYRLFSADALINAARGR